MGTYPAVARYAADAAYDPQAVEFAAIAAMIDRSYLMLGAVVELDCSTPVATPDDQAGAPAAGSAALSGLHAALAALHTQSLQ